MRLADLLLQEGVIDGAACEDIHESQTLYGGSFATNLLETGLIDEATLQKYLEQAYGIQNRIDVWGQPEPAAVKLFTRQQAEKYAAVPFRLEGRTVDLLVADPTDVRMADEAQFVTGCGVQLNVATEMRLAYHLYIAYRIVVPERMQALLAKKTWPKPEIEARRRKSTPPPVAREVEPALGDAMPSISIRAGTTLPGPVPAAHPVPGPAHVPRAAVAPIEPPAVAPIELPPPAPIELPAPAPIQLPAPASVTGLAHPAGRSVVLVETPAPAVAAGVADTARMLAPGADRAKTLPGTRRSYDGLAANLAEVEDREGIPAIVLPYLAAILTRVVLFTVRKNQLQGWDVRGRRQRREHVEQLTFPLDRPSVFSTVLESGTAFAGPLPQDDVEESFMIKLGSDGWPEAALVVPVRVNDRPIAMLYGEASGAEALASATEAATVLAGMVGETLNRLILANKADHQH